MREDRWTRNIIWILLCAVAILVVIALYLYFFLDEPLTLVGALLLLLLGMLLSHCMHPDRGDTGTAEWEARYREELLDALSGHVDDVFLLLEHDGSTVSYVSANVERLLGVPRESVLRDIHWLTKTAASGGDLVSAKERLWLESGQRISREREYIHQETGKRRRCRETLYRMSVHGADQYVVVIADNTKEMPVDVELHDETVLERSRIAMTFETGNDGDESIKTDEEIADELLPKDMLAGMLFLVVEDIRLNADLVSEMLSLEGAKSEIAENGQQALEMFRSSPPGYYDIVLMDVQMPVMNGYEATRAIRRCEHPDAKQIMIVAMTATAFPEDVQNALDAGMNAHMSKPIDMQIVKQTIHRLKMHD